MRNGTRSNANTPTAATERDAATSTATKTYLLPIDAHVALRLIRDELRLLSSLSEPRNDDDRDDIVVSTEALSDCFGRIAEQLDGVLGCTERL